MPTVPISVNFSRLDFGLVDVFAAVEDVASRYHLPPHLICIEITETALLDDPLPLRTAIDSLRTAGYQVWLDDFGSGYSSLNVLTEFGLDEVKLDIEFLRNFTDQGKRAIEAVVSMAHKLGLHTLAEGVETLEQADFLTSIECEKMQGYFFAKPMPLDTAVDYPETRRIMVETPREERLFTNMRPISMSSSQAIALATYDGSLYRFVYANETYHHYIKAVGFRSYDYLNDHLASDEAPAYERFRSAVRASVRDGRASVDFLEGGHYMRLTARCLAQVDELALVETRLVELDRDVLEGLSTHDRQARSLMSLYDGIYHVRVAEERVEVIRSTLPEYTIGDSFPFDRKSLEAYCQALIHPDDQDRFLRFMRPDRIHELADRSPRHEATSLFRELTPAGTYRWVLYDALVPGDDAKGNLLIACRVDNLAYMDEFREVMRTYTRSNETMGLLVP